MGERRFVPFARVVFLEMITLALVAASQYVLWHSFKVRSDGLLQWWHDEIIDACSRDRFVERAIG